MKSEDLMLNDWVLTKEGEPAQVYQIYNGIVALTAPSPNLYNVECLQPIKITPELLEKNGFSENYREDDLSYAQSCGDVIGIHILGKGGIMDEMYFKYVHELQHAFRLLNIEKEWTV